MRENELLNHFAKESAAIGSRFSRVLVGPGDDCAVLVGSGAGEGAKQLLKVDQLIEGRHFRTGTPLELVARKALARPLSDIAAMGGRPVACLCGAVLPAGFADSDAKRLFDAMRGWAERWECPLVGGDLAAFAVGNGSTTPLVLSVTVLGECVDEPVLRSSARVGDGVYVTGEIGGSFDERTGLGKHVEFVPRIAEAGELVRVLGSGQGRGLHAMMDVSDGLGVDAGRIARASGVGIRIEAEAVPLRSGDADVLRACGDGEDYELLFTVAAGVAVPPVISVLREGKRENTRVTKIGRVVAGSGVVLSLRDGSAVEIGERGWEHR